MSELPRRWSPHTLIDRMRCNLNHIDVEKEREEEEEEEEEREREENHYLEVGW